MWVKQWCLISSLLVAVAAVLVPASASAAPRFDWRSAGVIDSKGLTGLSCPGRSLCVAVDGAGDIVTSRRPLELRAAWSVSHIAGAAPMAGVSCATSTLCVAVDRGGNVITSSDPAEANAWSLSHVDDAVDASTGARGFSAVACPTSTLCVAVDVAGDVATSAAPAGGADAWTITHVDDGDTYECDHYDLTGPECQPALLAVSCGSQTLCVAVDDAGGIFTSTDPTGGASAWSSRSFDGPVPAAYSFDGVACPATVLCAGVDNDGGDIISWNPASGGSARTTAPLELHGIASISCPLDSLCFVVGYDGALYASSDPGGGINAWRITHFDKSLISGVSCLSSSSCLAVDDAGRLLIGNRLPPPAQLRALLRRHLSPFGRAARIGSLLARGTYAFSFAVPVSGRLTMAWDAPLRGRRASPLVARGAAQLETPGKVRIRLELTRAGRRLLRDSSRLTLIATATLRQAGGPVIRARRGFTLRR